MQLKNSGVVTSDRKGNATFAGGQMRSHSSAYFRELVETRERLVETLMILSQWQSPVSIR